MRNTTVARAGNTARGIPKIIASRSIRKMESRTGLSRMNEIASSGARNPDGRMPGAGGCGAIRKTDTTASR